MRHDIIHDMACDCDRCRDAHRLPAIAPADIAALKKGAIVALWVGGLLAAREFGPSILDWIAQ